MSAGSLVTGEAAAGVGAVMLGPGVAETGAADGVAEAGAPVGPDPLQAAAPRSSPKAAVAARVARGTRAPARRLALA
ncbi:MAG: hypothetical protein H0V74_02090 [Chloroflexi bacterium]|nr:hypothetical protein [Chloroflexota bacterium]